MASRIPELLGAYLTRHAEVRPDSTAVVDGERRCSYGDLDAQATRLARLLLEHALRPGDRVCLLTEKSTAALAAMLAVSRAGGVYVPLDLASPAPRTGLILKSSRPRIVLASAPALELLRELGATGALPADAVLGSLEREPLDVGGPECRFAMADAETFSDAALSPRARPDDAAHLLFTSGSTGVPKGVVITHANVRAFVDWATTYFEMTHSDRVSSHPPLHFDLSTFDIYGTFAVGAELHLVPAELNALPHKLTSFIQKAELTQWFSVPSLLSYMAKFDVVPRDGFPSLRRVLWCGEVLPTKTLIYWMERVRQASFTNLYGPTEATIASSYHRVMACPASETEPIPIGVPCAGEELLVLDEELRPVPAGVTGMLYIAGAGLSPGYWEDDERTREAFLPDPRDATGERCIYRTGDLARRDDSGLAYFLGRADSQIKSRGYRIELGEIETQARRPDRRERMRGARGRIRRIRGRLDLLCLRAGTRGRGLAGAAQGRSWQGAAPLHDSGELAVIRRAAEERQRQDRPREASRDVRDPGLTLGARSAEHVQKPALAVRLREDAPLPVCDNREVVLGNETTRLKVEPTGRNRFLLCVEASGGHVTYPVCETGCPLSLIEAIFRVRGSAVCDDILRDENPNYVALDLRYGLLAFLDETDFAGRRLLDFGCGTGASTMNLARMLTDTELVGVDLVPELIDVARLRADHHGVATRFEVSPRPDTLPDVGRFDFVVMHAVYEHLLPGERSTLLRTLWETIEPGGVLFLHATPNRWFPIERHTTGLPGLNYLPDRAACWASHRFSRRFGREGTWEELLRRGIRGATRKEILVPLEGGQLLKPCRLGCRDEADIWFRCATARNPRWFKRLAHVLFKSYKLTTGKEGTQSITIAVRKFN